MTNHVSILVDAAIVATGVLIFFIKNWWFDQDDIRPSDVHREVMSNRKFLETISGRLVQMESRQHFISKVIEGQHFRIMDMDPRRAGGSSPRPVLDSSGDDRSGAATQ